MESLNRNNASENTEPRPASVPAHPQDNEETEFENPSVDPGFESNSNEDGQEDQEINEDQGINKAGAGQENDALNYKNDREHGAYNPKNI